MQVSAGPRQLPGGKNPGEIAVSLHVHTAFLLFLMWCEEQSDQCGELSNQQEHRQRRNSGIPLPGAAGEAVPSWGRSLRQKENGNLTQFCQRKRMQCISNHTLCISAFMESACFILASSQVKVEQKCYRKGFAGGRGGTPKTLDGVQYSGNKTLRSRHHYKIIDCGEQSHIPRWSIGHLTYQ